MVPGQRLVNLEVAEPALAGRLTVRIISIIMALLSISETFPAQNLVETLLELTRTPVENLEEQFCAPRLAPLWPWKVRLLNTWLGHHKPHKFFSSIWRLTLYPILRG